MNQKQFYDYKIDYLNDLHDELEDFLNHWIEINNAEVDKKLNDLVSELFINTFKRIKTLSFFDEYDLP